MSITGGLHNFTPVMTTLLSMLVSVIIHSNEFFCFQIFSNCTFSVFKKIPPPPPQPKTYSKQG